LPDLIYRLQLLAKIVNDPKYESQVGKSRHALWMQLCGLITKNPDKVTSLPVEAIIRNGLNKFSAEVGQLWVSLADYHVRSGHFEKARDVYEEGVSTVSTVKDFSLIYDAYLAVEEGLLQTKMAQNGEDNSGAGALSQYVDGFTAQDEVELRLGRLDHLVRCRFVTFASFVCYFTFTISAIPTAHNLY
jgi:pre-mRNA-splicing factor SYF1